MRGVLSAAFASQCRDLTSSRSLHWGKFENQLLENCACMCVLFFFFKKKNSAPEKQQIVRALTVVLTLFQNSAHTLAVTVSASTRVCRSFRFHHQNSVFIFTFLLFKKN